MIYSANRYQKDLIAATERQASLEQAKTQVELDWQRRFEDVERSQFERSEDLVKSLGKAKDEVSVMWITRLEQHKRTCSHFILKYKYGIDIVACQRGGVSNKPPGLQTATRHGARDPLVRSQVD